MTSLDWNLFNQLPGSRYRNFEDLCRAMVRSHYGGYGKFRALKNQPGVEFHIELTQEHSALGGVPRWWGWQCKDHARISTGNLSAASKNDIEDSLRKAEKYLPDLTDWVLWAPYTLSKKDQGWLNGLSSRFEIHIWAEEEIESHLDGAGLLLRQTYFGELVVTPPELETRHKEAIRPIIERWLEPVHQEVSVERDLRQILGAEGSWDEIAIVGERLANAIHMISKFSAPSNADLKKALTAFCAAASELSTTLVSSHDMFKDGDLDVIQINLQSRTSPVNKDVSAVPRRLRSQNLPIALDATNALDDMLMGIDLLNRVDDSLGVGLVAVLADAGGGKTQMAAQLTAPTQSRPAGILLHGRALHKGQSLDDLASSFQIGGKPMASMETMLAGLDAAGKRARCRLPIVIDGLNEAENPKDWRRQLASLNEIIKRYPNVVVICTLRTGEHRRDRQVQRQLQDSSSRESFAEMALPSGMRKIESEGFGEDTRDAIDKYFSYFKILPGDSPVPTHLFRHPLTLRIFCQTTNPDRNSDVRVDYFPASLTPLFEKYLDHTCRRIAQLENLDYSYTKEEIQSAIHQFGIVIWNTRKREINESEFRVAVADSSREWNSSIVNLLAQEGIIFRNPAGEPGNFVLTPVYDALGGFIVARALLEKDQDELPFGWLRKQEPPNWFLATISKLFFWRTSIEDPAQIFVGENSHELSADIFRALVALTPLKFQGRQFWKELPESLQIPALRFTMEIDAKSIDPDTVNELLRVVNENPSQEARLFARLIPIRNVKDHPLNARFVDKILRSLTVADRDLSWTEWVRDSRGRRLADVADLERKWQKETMSSSKDSLCAKWLMWLLTSTDRELRDVTTRALYWFGKGNPEALFDEAILSLDINDLYVSERMLAASYGVAIACYSSNDATDFSLDTLKKFSLEIFDSMFAATAPYRTTHCLMRDYASRVIELANIHIPGLFTTEDLEKSKPPYALDPSATWGEVDFEQKNMGSGESPLRMDFEKYTIGHLVSDRGNYNYKDVEYRHTRAKILWRIEQLGWSSGRFSKIERSISHRQNSSRIPVPTKTDRYGKKYSWIAYFELVGVLNDQGKLDRFGEHGRSSDVDIDPSFPESVADIQQIKDDYLGSSTVSMKDWIENGPLPNLDPNLRIKSVKDQVGPWVMLDGHISQQDEKRGRKIFIFIRSFLISLEKVDDFEKYLNRQSFAGSWLPEKPSFHYTFAGEIPWCSTYPAVGNKEFAFVEREEEVEVERTDTEYLLDGESVELTTKDLLRLTRTLVNVECGDESPGLSDEELSRLEIRKTPKKIKEIKKHYTKFDAVIPACDFSWESYHSVTNSAGHAITLAKELADELRLRGCPQAFELFCDAGVPATIQTAYRPDDYFNSQSLMYLREDLLKRYLEAKGMALIWVVWGEREFSTDQVDKLFHGSTRPDPAYKVFSKIFRF